MLTITPNGVIIMSKYFLEIGKMKNKLISILIVMLLLLPVLNGCFFLGLFSRESFSRAVFGATYYEPNLFLGTIDESVNMNVEDIYIDDDVLYIKLSSFAFSGDVYALKTFGTATVDNVYSPVSFDPYNLMIEIPLSGKVEKPTRVEITIGGNNNSYVDMTFTIAW